MGNSCSDSYHAKFKAPVFEIHIKDFRQTYRSFKFPKNVSFTHDPNIFRVRHLPTNEPRILKRIHFDTEKSLYIFIIKLQTMMSIEHDHLLKIHHYAVEKNNLKDQTISFTLNVIFEHFDHTLFDELQWREKAEKPFTENEIQQYINGLTDALEFLQHKSSHHGHIRPSNIYIGSSNKLPKLMFLGDQPAESNISAYRENISNLNYLAPQMRSQVVDSLFPDKMRVMILQDVESPNVMCSPYKSDVFSLGLILLEMMTMKSIEGLNGDNCQSMRQYRVNQCDKIYSSSVCNIVELMLKDNEMHRPDFLDLKRMLVREEYVEYLKTRSTEEKKSAEKDHHRAHIELKTIENRCEFQLPANYFLNSSEDTELSILNQMSDELTTKSKNARNSKASSLSRDLSPTKAYTDPNKDGSHGKKDSGEAGEAFLSEWAEEREGGHEGFLGNLVEEMFIDNEKDLLAHSMKFLGLRKLVINLEEKQYSKETSGVLSEFLSNQVTLNELVLALPKNKLGDEGLEMICGGLEKLKEMSLCYFDLRKNKISDRGVNILGRGLPEKERLVQCGLNLSDNNITKDGCKEISEWFGQLGNVTSLALNLGGNKIGNEGVEALVNGMEKLTSLDAFVVFLHQNDIEGKESVEMLFKGLKEIKGLKKLKVDLSGNLLGDEDIEPMIEYLRECEIDVEIELKDNCVSEEKRNEIEKEILNKEDVKVVF